MHNSARGHDKCLMHVPVVSPARAGTVATHAWTKLHTRDESLVYMSAIYARTLSEATSTIVHNLIGVSSLLLKVHSCTNYD